MALFPPQGGGENGAGATDFALVALAASPAATLGEQRKPRGRPRGSKNKPKAAVAVTRESDAAMRSVVLEVSSRADVVAAVIGFARRRGVGVSVISGCGVVSDVTLRHPACSSTLTFRGQFDILSLAGAFLPAAPSSSSAVAPVIGSYFTISLAGNQGDLMGGVVEGPLIAAGTVRLVVAIFASLEIQKLTPPRGEEGEGGAMAPAGEEPNRQILEGERATTTMEMVYNVGPAGEVPAEAATWTSHAGRAGTTRYRNPPNQFHLYY